MVGKLLVWAACIGCLAPALTIAAILSGRSIFVTSVDQQEAAAQARKQFSAKGGSKV